MLFIHWLLQNQFQKRTILRKFETVKYRIPLVQTIICELFCENSILIL